MLAELSAVTSLVSSLKASIELAKVVASTYGTLDKAEVRLKLAELLGALADAKLVVIEINESLREKDEEIRVLTEQLQAHASMHYEAPHYWSDQGAGREGPFCQRCFDVSRKAIHLQAIEDKRWQCLACNATYNDPGYEPPPAVRVMKIRRDVY